MCETFNRQRNQGADPSAPGPGRAAIHPPRISQRETFSQAHEQADPQAGIQLMGDKRPAKKSSGNSDAHKAKVEKDRLARPTRPATESNPKKANR